MTQTTENKRGESLLIEFFHEKIRPIVHFRTHESSGSLGGGARVESAADGGDECGGVVFLNHVAKALLLGLLCKVTGGQEGIEQDGSVGEGCEKFASGAPSVALGHGDVKDEQVGLEFDGFLDDRVAVGEGGADFAAQAAKEEGDGGAHLVGVVGDEYARGHLSCR